MSFGGKGEKRKGGKCKGKTGKRKCAGKLDLLGSNKSKIKCKKGTKRVNFGLCWKWGTSFQRRRERGK
jgi:hypothetical protein